MTTTTAERFNFVALISKIFPLSYEEKIAWLRSKNLLPTDIICLRCFETTIQSKLTPNVANGGAGGDGTFYRCQKKAPGADRKHSFKQSLFRDTWFESSKWSIDKILLLSYMFANGYTKHEDMIAETSTDENITTSSETVNDWLSYCRETCATWLLKYCEQRGKIGGPGKIVEVDESMIGKMKSRLGRPGKGQWILGMIERDDGERKGRMRLKILPNRCRNRQTLTKYLVEFIEPGTLLLTDYWRGYGRLEERGFGHMKVNHSRGFVDPATGAHTQTIESNWRAMKRGLNRGGIPLQNLGFHLAEFLWRRETRRRGRNLFLGFLEIAARVYDARRTNSKKARRARSEPIDSDSSVGLTGDGGVGVVDELAEGDVLDDLAATSDDDKEDDEERDPPYDYDLDETLTVARMIEGRARGRGGGSSDSSSDSYSYSYSFSSSLASSDEEKYATDCDPEDLSSDGVVVVEEEEGEEEDDSSGDGPPRRRLGFRRGRGGYRFRKRPKKGPPERRSRRPPEGPERRLSEGPGSSGGLSASLASLASLASSLASNDVEAREEKKTKKKKKKKDKKKEGKGRTKGEKKIGFNGR